MNEGVFTPLAHMAPHRPECQEILPRYPQVSGLGSLHYLVYYLPGQTRQTLWYVVSVRLILYVYGFIDPSSLRPHPTLI